MKYKVAELDGALLDAAVAKAEGLEYSREQYFDRDAVTLRSGEDFAPSTDWADGGQIIERERIWLGFCGDESDWPGQWFAQVGEEHPNFHQIAPTALIAAMRAYVASKFGEEVELP